MPGSPFNLEVDDVTLARAKKGDVRACETIFRLFQRPAYSAAFRICQCPDLAQEAIQEAFITAFARMGQYRGDAPFWAWLRRVVINHTLTALRKSGGHQQVELCDERTPEKSAPARVGLAMDLESALATLGPEDRAVVWLHDVEGYNHREIADMFDKTESFSKTRLSRARARLREMLEPAEAAECALGSSS
jgi:RNA polymerase sigma-70 factor (ECF subfamily)